MLVSTNSYKATSEEKGLERTKKRSSSIWKSITKADFLLCAFENPKENPYASETPCFLLTPFFLFIESQVISCVSCFRGFASLSLRPYLCVCSMQMGGLLKVYQQIKICSCKYSYWSSQHSWENVEFKALHVWLKGKKWYEIHSFTHPLTHKANLLRASVY